MSASELVPEPLDPELALAAQAEDQRLLLVEDLAARQGARPMAARLQSCLALGLVAPPPLAPGRPRDAAAPTGDPGVAELLVEPDPAEPCARVHASSPADQAVDLRDDALRCPHPQTRPCLTPAEMRVG